MPLPIDPENVRKKVQRAEVPSSKGVLASEQLPLEVVQLLDVVRIEIRRQARRRFLKTQGIALQPSIQKLTPEELEEAYDLLRADVPFREVARQFDISNGSLAKLVKRDGVVLKSKGEKLTPTQRRLTEKQQQEAQDLVGAGVSLRLAAKQLGISRNSLVRILKDGEKEGRK